MEEIRFSGLVSPKSQDGKTPPFKEKKGISNWFDVLEQAFMQLTETDEGKKLYGDPQKGATLEQIWRVAGMVSGRWPVCLLASGRPDVPVKDIEKVVKLNAVQLTEVMADMLQISDRVAIQILYYDGSTGHSITLMDFDPAAKRFTYYDPWPDFSLLSKEYNMAGVNAVRVDRQIWSMTADELASVVFAALVPKLFWAVFSGDKYSVLFEDLKKSEFWNFFNISIDKTEKDGDKTYYYLKTGGFREEIDIKLCANVNGELTENNLLVNRNWLLGPPYGINPFGLDIIRSFINALVSPLDLQFVGNIYQLFELGHVQDYLGMFQQGKTEHSMYSRIMKVYFGMDQNYHIPLDYSDLLFRNFKEGDKQIFLVQTRIDSLD